MRIRLDHVAIVVKDIQKAVADWETALGIPCERVESVASERTRVAFFETGDSHLELVSPEDTDAPIARSLEKRGEGLHHICLEVEDLDTTLEALGAQGLRLVHETPGLGAGGRRIAFVHPRSLNGVLVELVEKSG